MSGLLRLAWRRDRVMILVTVAVVWVLTYYSVAAMKTLYASPAELRLANAEANASTGVVAMYGTIHDLVQLPAEARPETIRRAA